MSSLVSKIYIPETLEELTKYARELAVSTIIPKDYQRQPANIIVTLQKGLALNLAPIQALECFSIISGTSAIKSSAYAGLARRTGELEEHSETFDYDETNKVIGATVTVKRKGYKTHIETFTMEMATKMGLPAKNPNYVKMPERMLLARANSFAFRKEFSDVFLGMGYSVEELEDIERDPIKAKDVTPEKKQIGDNPILYGGMNAMQFNSVINEKIESIVSVETLRQFHKWKEENLVILTAFCKDHPDMANSIAADIELVKSKFCTTNI